MLREGTQGHRIFPSESPNRAGAEMGDAVVQIVQAKMIKMLVYFIIASL